MNESRLLITGGAGFIGSYLTERLVLQNSEIVIIDDFSTGRIGNLKKIENLQTLKIEKHDISKPL